MRDSAGISRHWSALAITLMALVGLAQAQVPVDAEAAQGEAERTEDPLMEDALLQVQPRRQQGTLYLGLTPLGPTPIQTPLPIGRSLLLAVYAPGFHPARRTIKTSLGAQIQWRPLLHLPLLPPSRDWSPKAPGWVRTPCGSDCGIGAAAHFSPIMAYNLAIGRALTEQARSRNLRVSLMDASYEELRGAQQQTTSAQRTDVRFVPGGVQVWRGPRRTVARVGGVSESTIEGLGAPNGLWPTDAMAQAKLAALVGALRWQHVFAGGLHVRALVRTYVDGLEGGRYLDDIHTLSVKAEGPCGALHWEQRDYQRLLMAPGERRPTQAWATDWVALDFGDYGIELHDGVLVRLKGTAEAAYTALYECLDSANYRSHPTHTPHPDGGVLVTTELVRSH